MQTRVPLRLLLQPRCLLPSLATFTAIVLSLLILRSQLYHTSLTPLDRHIFSCKASIAIENIPKRPDPPRPIPSPIHPAKRIKADELLDSHDAFEKYKGRLIHQSWKTDDVSTSKYAEWKPIEKWSAYHSADEGWHYVLWTNEDNRKLVEKLFPQFLELFDAFPWEILRADFVRPLYMAAFGGVYADLDLVPLSNLGHHLHFGVNGTAWLGQIHLPNPTAKIMPYSVPNAFLASSGPGHPFWTMYANNVDERWRMGEINFDNIEDATGPAQLYRVLQRWYEHEGRISESSHTSSSSSKKKSDIATAGSHDRVIVLPEDKIYPFSWASETHGERCVCFAGRAPEFDPERCQELFKTAWTITYWRSGWMGDVGSS